MKVTNRSIFPLLCVFIFLRVLTSDWQNCRLWSEARCLAERILALNEIVLKKDCEYPHRNRWKYLIFSSAKVYLSHVLTFQVLRRRFISVLMGKYCKNSSYSTEICFVWGMVESSDIFVKKMWISLVFLFFAQSVAFFILFYREKSNDFDEKLSHILHLFFTIPSQWGKQSFSQFFNTKKSFSQKRIFSRAISVIFGLFCFL